MHSMVELPQSTEIAPMLTSQPQNIHTFSETSAANMNHQNQEAAQHKSYLIAQRQIASNVTQAVAPVMEVPIQTALTAEITHQRITLMCAFATMDILVTLTIVSQLEYVIQLA